MVVEMDQELTAGAGTSGARRDQTGRTMRAAWVALLVLLLGTVAGLGPGRGQAAGPAPTVRLAAEVHPTAAARPAVATLTILYTNDTHSHLLPFDMPAFGKNLGGIARRAAYIRAVRAATPHVLLLDGGDIFQGTPFFSFFKGEADLRAFDLCGYDATTLGNHELDEGIPHLRRMYQIASMALLCANVREARTGELVFPAWRLFERAGRTIAVLGVIGSEAWSVTPAAHRAGYDWIEPRRALPPLLARLRPQADLVVLLSHSGYEEDQALAAAVPGIDVIIGGHTNTFLEHPVLVKPTPLLVPGAAPSAFGGTLIVQAFKWGYYIGRLDIGFGPEGVLGFAGHLQPLDASIGVPLDCPVARLVSGYEEQIRARTSLVVGDCPVDLLYPEEEKHVRALPLGTLVCEALRRFAGGDLALMNSGSIRDGIPAGPITMGRVFQVLPFDNTVVTFTMSGAAIRDMLGFICANHGRITGYQYAGVTCVFDLAAGQVRDIRIGGAPLEPERDYRVVTISYLADGNQNGHELFKAARDKSDTGFLMRDALVDWLRRHPRLDPPPADVVAISGRPAVVTAVGSSTSSPGTPGPKRTD